MSHLLYADGEPVLLIEIRSSWNVSHGDVWPLGTTTRRMGRERQHAKIRERIAATGKTRADDLSEARRILRERIAAKGRT